MATTTSSARQVETFAVPSMDCAEEMSLIQRGLLRHPGIGELEPHYLDRRLRVSFDPRQTDPLRIAAAITKLGFPAQVATRRAEVSPPQGRTWRFWTTTTGGVLLLLAIVAWIAPRMLAGGGGWTPPLTLAAYILCVLSTIVAGAPVARAGWRAARLRAADMNLLMTIAATGAIAIGEFFEAATAMFLFGVSLLLESYSLERTRRAVRGLAALAPTVAHQLSDGQTRDVDPAELSVDDLVLVKPGERVPVDGLLVDGVSSVNEAPVTGESIPVEKERGDRLYAGSLNGEGSLTLRVLHTAGESTLARIARLVADAQASRAPTARFVDEFAGYYTPAVIALAVAIVVGPLVCAWLGFGWASAVPASEWFRRGLVLLVIACPCALVISTPVTIVCGLYRAARSGLLAKGGEQLEKAALVDCVALDKTGTITSGQATVVRVEPAGDATEREVLEIAASLESSSEHPLAAAIVRAARERGITPRAAADFVARRGFGVEGRLAGRRFLVGSPRMIENALPSLRAKFNAEHDAATAVGVAAEDRFLGTIYLADPPRPDAAAAVADLKRAGVERVIMLTGDRAGVAARIAQQVGVDEFQANLLPEDKVSHVRRLAERQPHLAMVGDGVNDAPALAAARLGIALGSGASDLALETADVVILSPHLGRVADFIRLGRRVRRHLWQNISLALAIKGVVLVLAAAGPVTLWMAVVADVGASLLVIGNGMRLIRPPVGHAPRA